MASFSKSWADSDDDDDMDLNSIPAFPDVVKIEESAMLPDVVDSSDESEPDYSSVIGKAPCQDVLDLLDIPTSLAGEVSVCDALCGLQLVHYIRCTDSSPDCIKNARGVVVDIIEKKVVCRSMPYTTEIVTDDVEKMSDYVPNEINILRLYKASEGTVIRVFYYKPSGRWMWATHHNLDAYDSRWGDTTFGLMFEECIKMAIRNGFSQKMLDPDVCYAFLMTHAENTIVCHDQAKLQLYLISAYDRKTVKLDAIPSKDVPELTGIHTTKTDGICIYGDDITRMVDELDITQYSGYILERDGMVIKLSSPQYMEFRNIRGDNPNINVRYLELTRSGKFDLAQKLVDMNARLAPRFSKIEDEMRQLNRTIYDLYVSKYITKTCTLVPKTEYMAVRHIHQWHLSDRRVNIITRDKTTVLINKMHPSDIWKLIKDRVIPNHN